MTKEQQEYLQSLNGMEVAIIGYGIRFPGVTDGEGFWQQLSEEQEMLHMLDVAELEQLEVPPHVYNHEKFVNVVVTDPPHKQSFDHVFFGYTPDEARAMDPQIRVFHELVWEALERGGYAGQRDRHKIGLFAGAASSFSHELVAMATGLYTRLGENIASRLANKDFLCSRIAYNLNLTGPCYMVQTGCSTSLVAIHQAVRSLLTGECKMALAGGISIFTQQNKGYIHEEGGVLSSDGHCRAFDAAADGTIFGDGGGVLLLKRLRDAIQDNDHILAVIKGSAINNDGNRKVGFTAPSIEGQADVIRLAHKIAGISPVDLQLIEAHGTGTRLGDPVELKALELAFHTTEKQYCAIGSVKTNTGHLDNAAGIAGAMKVILSLQHKKIPASLHYQQPNPGFNLAASPFYINHQLQDFPLRKGPKLAAVSSFGIGGTNAHIVMTEAPVFNKEIVSEQKQELLVLSAKTAAALEASCLQLQDYFRQTTTETLADIAFSLANRAAFHHRAFIIAGSNNEALEALSGQQRTTGTPAVNAPLVFMFGGQGSQYAGMCSGLYKEWPLFRQEADRLLALLPAPVASAVSQVFLEAFHTHVIETDIAQLLLFMIEYALARILMAVGIRPDYMIGHSIGEYVAACIAGVFTEQDALDLVTERGRLMKMAPEGAMVSIQGTIAEVAEWLDEEIVLAVTNSKNLQVLAGPLEKITQLCLLLEKREIRHVRLSTNKAFHSPAMEEVLPAFKQMLDTKKMSAPVLPFISNVSGRIAGAEVAQSAYWTGQLRNTVHFAEGLDELINKGNCIFLEIGAGKVLTTFVKDHLGTASTINLIRHPKDNVADYNYILNGIGRLWLWGKAVDWSYWYQGRHTGRIPLPVYPFERRDFSADTTVTDIIKMAQGRLRPATGIANLHDYTPGWKIAPPVDPAENPLAILFGRVDTGLLPADKIISVLTGKGFNGSAQNFTLDTSVREELIQLFDTLKNSAITPSHLIYNIGDNNANEYTKEACKADMQAIVNIAGSYAAVFGSKKVWLKLICRNTREVIGNDVAGTLQGLLAGLLQALKAVYNFIGYTLIDIDVADAAPETFAPLLATEMLAAVTDEQVALRRGNRWVSYPVPLTPAAGNAVTEVMPAHILLAGITSESIALALQLAAQQPIRCFSFYSTWAFPVADSREQWLQHTAADNPVSVAIRACQELEAAGIKVQLYTGHLHNTSAIIQLLQKIGTENGPINRIIYTLPVNNITVSGWTDADIDTLLDDACTLLAWKNSLPAAGNPSLFMLGGAPALLASFADTLCQQPVRNIPSLVQIMHHPAFDNAATNQPTEIAFPAYPLLQAMCGKSGLVWETQARLTSATDWVLWEHRTVDQQPTFPAHGYIDLIYTWAVKAGLGDVIEIKDLFFLSPLVVPIGETALLQLSAEYVAGSWSIRVGSNHVQAAGVREHARAIVQVLENNQPVVLPLANMKAAIEGTEIVIPVVKEAAWKEFGPRWQSVRKVKPGKDEAMAELSLDTAYTSDTGIYNLHPALMDNAASFYYMALKGENQFLPYYIDRIVISGKLPAAVCSHVKLTTNRQQEKDLMAFDIRITDPAGVLLVDIRQQTFKAYRPASRPPAVVATEQPVLPAAIPVSSWYSLFHNISAQRWPLISYIDIRLPEAQAAADNNAVAVVPETAATYFKEREGISAAYVAPVTVIEQQLVQEWEAFFCMQPLGIMDDFFEVGGDSLKSNTIISRIRKRFEVELSISEFFNQPVIREQAALIQSKKKSSHVYDIRRSEKREYYPLSYAQKRIYLLERMSGRHANYNITDAIMIKGEVDAPRIEAIFNQLVNRHESLRTSIVILNREPFQRVHEAVALKLEYREIDGDNIAAAFRRFRRPFDFDSVPQIRVGLFKAATNVHYLVVDMWHLFADGTSLLLLKKEFLRLYYGGELKQVVFQYADYAEWQRRILLSEKMSRKRAYWEKQLEGYAGPIALPVDNEQGEMAGAAGDSYHFEIDETHTRALKQLVKEHNVTEFNLMLALFNVLFYHLTNNDDIIIGVPNMNRNYEAFDEVIGMFVNTLVLRNRVNPEMVFTDFLKSVKRHALEAVENQDFQYEMMLDMLRAGNKLGSGGLFNVILNYRNLYVKPEESNASGHGEFVAVGVEDTSVKADISLFVHDRDYNKTISLSCTYRKERYAADTIAYIMGQFIALVKQVIAAPQAPLGTYSLFRVLPDISQGAGKDVFAGA